LQTADTICHKNADKMQYAGNSTTLRTASKNFISERTSMQLLTLADRRTRNPWNSLWSHHS